MRRIVLVIALVLLVFSVAGAQELKDIEEAYLKIVRRIKPSVVAVTVMKTTSIQRGGRHVKQVSSAQFSGVVVSGEGHIATIAKGVEGAAAIFVETLDGDRRRAEVVGVDKRLNIGIIKVENTQDWTAKPAEFGDSGKLEVGSLTVIVGCPSGLKHSIVYGNVSGLDRTLVSERTYYTGMIQLSNPVSHSDPGGLVANSEGKLVGMVSPAFIKTPSFRRVEELIEALNKKIADLSAKLARVKEEEKDERKPRTPPDEVIKGIIRKQLPAELYDPALSQGINFAIPGNAVKQVCDRVIRGQKQAWVGVLVRPLTPPEKAQYGVNGIFVLQVVPNSPASSSGLKRNDIIMRAGEKEVESSETFRDVIKKAGVGAELKLTVYRKKNQLDVKLKLGERK